MPEDSENSAEIVLVPFPSAVRLEGTLILPGGRRVALHTAVAIVGRGSPALEVDLSAEPGAVTVPRRQARITRIDDHFELEAHYSINEVRLNDELLVPGRSYRLRSGDVIEFGTVRCVFRI